MFLWPGVPDFTPLLSQPHPSPPTPFFFLGWHLMLQWNGEETSETSSKPLWGLKALMVKQRRSFAVQICQYLNQRLGRRWNVMMGKINLRFHHFGAHDMVYGDGSGEEILVNDHISRRWRGRCLEERTNKLLLWTRCSTFCGWCHLTSLKFAYMNWDAGANA